MNNSSCSAHYALRRSFLMCLRHKDEQKIKAIRKTSHFLRCCLLTLFRVSPIILLGAYPNSERKDSSYELQKHVCMNTDRAKPMGSICRGDAGRKQVRFLCFCHKKHGLEQVAATVLKTADTLRSIQRHRGSVRPAHRSALSYVLRQVQKSERCAASVQTASG